MRATGLSAEPVTLEHCQKQQSTAKKIKISNTAGGGSQHSSLLWIYRCPLHLSTDHEVTKNPHLRNSLLSLALQLFGVYRSIKPLTYSEIEGSISHTNKNKCKDHYLWVVDVCCHADTSQGVKEATCVP